VKRKISAVSLKSFESLFYFQISCESSGKGDSIVRPLSLVDTPMTMSQEPYSIHRLD
jgi:hypothetical protein